MQPRDHVDSRTPAATTRPGRAPAALTAGVVAGCLGACLGVGCRDGSAEPRAIAGPEPSVASLVGAPAEQRPLVVTDRKHPQVAGGGVGTMHCGADNTDVHLSPGPLGRKPRVGSRRGSWWPGGMCTSTAFDRGGRLIVVCGSLAGLELNLLEPRTLVRLARYELPARPSTFAALVTFDADKAMRDTSGGLYFYLDRDDNVVLADSRQQVTRIGHRRDDDGEWEFFPISSWDLSEHVPHDCLAATNWRRTGECDAITAVLPDHGGLIWWVTRNGRIGTLDPTSAAVRSMQLGGEGVRNGFAVAADGVFIVSDHAVYGLDTAADGTPRIVWREGYDRGSNRKPGAIHQGAGATPTLLGEGYVATTDNADGRVNLLVYRRELSRQGPRLVCKKPLFRFRGSVAEASMIGWGRSLIVQNTFGYMNAFQQEDWTRVVGGITRIDVREDGSGCDEVWTSEERSPSGVAKLSAANGLAYFYTFEPQADGDNAWHLTALDASNGRTAFKIRTGVGSNFDINRGAIALGADGTAYASATKGIVAVWDEER